MAIFSETKVTSKGKALIAKVLSGQTKFNFDIVQAGDGHFDGNPEELTKLISHRLDGRIVDVREMGEFTELECVITNQHLTAYMEFREFGIRADDPEHGSILFAYANAGDNASPVGHFNGVWLHEFRLVVRVHTANATNITATIVASAFASEITFINKGTGLSAENVQGAIRELAAMMNVGNSLQGTGLNATTILGAITELAEMFTEHIKETVYAEEPHGMRFNSETGALEVNNGYGWQEVAGGSGSNGSSRLGMARFGSARFGAM